MSHRLVAAAALVFSGFTALVYEILWTRLLGFTFGTTSEAIGTVLAVFFAGMALGNAVITRYLPRITRPLRVYAWLEIGIGVYALATLPLLARLDAIYAVVGPDISGAAFTALRLAAAALILLPPTFAMGATLPVVAKGVVDVEGTQGRWSGLLYGTNTLGSVLGAYVSGFWGIPFLGLTRSILLAAAVNVLVGGAVLAILGKRRVTSAGGAGAPQPGAGRLRALYLALFAISGFLAIGYEMVWAKLFGIVMEGTLYGFATVLSGYLLGIGLGSVLVAPFVDRIASPLRVYGWLHVAIAFTVAIGATLVPELPGWRADWLVRFEGSDPTHLAYGLVLPIVLAPAILFGAAFPVLIRVVAPDASQLGVGLGRAVALNTAGSIAASLSIGFWANTALGMSRTLSALLALQLGMAGVALCLLAGGGVARRAGAALALGLFATWLGTGWDGISVARTIAGRMATDNGATPTYHEDLEEHLARQVSIREGRNTIVSLHDWVPMLELRNNGMPESGTLHGPPYMDSSMMWLGVAPYLLAERPERALLIGLGGGQTLEALNRTGVEHIEVVELEAGVVDAVERLHEGAPNPLEDPRVHHVVGDGRNELVRGRYRAEPGFDLIVSQPSHPWLMGSASLFTKDFFELARDNLRPGGSFAVWVNGYRTTPDALRAIVGSFHEVFPGAWLLDTSGHMRSDFLLVGGHAPIRVDVARARARLAEPRLAELMARYHVRSLENALAAFEGPASAYAAIEPTLRNTDENAYVETRVPRVRSWRAIDFQEIQARLPESTPVVPPLSGEVDWTAVAATMRGLATPPPRSSLRRKLLRLLAVHPVARGDAQAIGLELASGSPERVPQSLERLRELAGLVPDSPEPHRAIGRIYVRGGGMREAGLAFAEAHRRSGAAEDAIAAAKAYDHVDPERASTWLARVPEAVREAEPRLSLIAASEALRRGAGQDELREHLSRVLRFRATAAGHTLQGVERRIAELARAVGDRALTQAFSDADSRERARQASREVAFGRAALARGDLGPAIRALGRARELAPGASDVLEYAVDVAGEARDGAALAAALDEIELWAPTFEEGRAKANKIRVRFGRPKEF